MITQCCIEDFDFLKDFKKFEGFILEKDGGFIYCDTEYINGIPLKENEKDSSVAFKDTFEDALESTVAHLKVLTKNSNYLAFRIYPQLTKAGGKYFFRYRLYIA